MFTVYFSISVRRVYFLLLWASNCVFEFVAEKSGTFFIYLSFLFRDVPSEHELDAAQYSLMSIRNDMRSRKEEAARREESMV